jgi:hypothetical protein
MAAWVTGPAETNFGTLAEHASWSLKCVPHYTDTVSAMCQLCFDA